MGRVADALAGLTKGAMAVFMAATAAVISAEVFCRYALNSSLYFAEELSRFCFIWAGFLGTSLALRQGSHVGVTLLVDRLSGTARARTAALAHALVGALLAIVLVTGASVLPDQWGQQTATLGFSVFWFYLAVPVGAFLMLVQTLALLREPRSLR